jgi:hypothetical protein
LNSGIKFIEGVVNAFVVMRDQRIRQADRPVGVEGVDASGKPILDRCRPLLCRRSIACSSRLAGVATHGPPHRARTRDEGSRQAPKTQLAAEGFLQGAKVAPVLHLNRTRLTGRDDSDSDMWSRGLKISPSTRNNETMSALGFLKWHLASFR